MTTLTNKELANIILDQLPRLLDEEPALLVPLYKRFLESFVDWEAFGRLQQEFAEHQVETRNSFQQVDHHIGQVEQKLEDFQAETRENFEQVDQRFEQVDRRFEQVDQRFDSVDQRFDRLEGQMQEIVRSIDRLGQRWGIRNESLFRATMAELLEESFGVKVQRQIISGEEFDVIISNGDHILVEITASVKRNIQERLERKREIYTQETGVQPARFILAVASIHSKRAQALTKAGFIVIEPEEETLVD